MPDAITECSLRAIQDNGVLTVTLKDMSRHNVCYKDIVLRFQRDGDLELFIEDIDRKLATEMLEFYASVPGMARSVDDWNRFKVTCEVAAQIKEFVSGFSSNPSVGISDFVAMKIVSRFKELRKADPGKAKTGGLDLTWAKELYQAGKQAELLEETCEGE